MIAAGSAVLLVALIAAALRLTGSSHGSVRVGANSLAAIDTRSNWVVGAVVVGTSPGGIAFGSGSLWVADLDDQTVSRIDPTTLRPLRTLPVGGAPTGIAASSSAVWVMEPDPSASAPFS